MSLKLQSDLGKALTNVNKDFALISAEYLASAQENYAPESEEWGMTLATLIEPLSPEDKVELLALIVAPYIDGQDAAGIDRHFWLDVGASLGEDAAQGLYHGVVFATRCVR